MKPKSPPERKKVEFLGSSLADVRGFPDDAQDDLGHQLDSVQMGAEPADWAPMKTVGAGVKELRYQDQQGWFRVVYIATYKDAVYVLHAFQKKSNQTSPHDIDVAKKRLSDLERKQK